MHRRAIPTVNGTVLAQVTFTGSDLQFFNALTGNQFAGRVEALKDCDKVETAARYVAYDASIPHPPEVDDYNITYIDWKMAQLALFQGEDALKKPGSGMTPEALLELKTTFATADKALIDKQAELRSGSLRAKGFEPYNPKQIRDEVLSAPQTARISTAPGDLKKATVRIDLPVGHANAARRSKPTGSWGRSMTDDSPQKQTKNQWAFAGRGCKQQSCFA